jgi:methylglutaconyl-CoA hydratase
MAYEFLAARRDGPVEHLLLNRPDTRNAFNEHVIRELTEWAGRTQAAARRRDVRVAVLAGAGPMFCAGADVTWMSKTVQYTEEENVRDATALSRMFTALNELPLPLIARVQGAALGGGAGLAAVCDIVVAADDAVFGFTEVKLGILPAVIAPFALAKIGRSAARELFLTGARFSAARAREIGLAHVVVPAADLDATVARYIKDLLGAGPEAIAAAKELIALVWGQPADQATSLTARAIAMRRVSAEGQEGLKAFLEKRKPSWSG